MKNYYFPFTDSVHKSLPLPSDSLLETHGQQASLATAPRLMKSHVFREDSASENSDGPLCQGAGAWQVFVRRLLPRAPSNRQ